MTEKESETEKKRNGIKWGKNRYRGSEKDGGRREVKIEEREGDGGKERESLSGSYPVNTLSPGPRFFAGG